MGKLSHLQTISDAWLGAMGQSAVLRVTGPAEARTVSLYDVATRSEDRLDLTRETLNLSDITTTTRAASATTEITMNGTAHTLDRAPLAELAQQGGSAQAYLDGVGFYGLKTVLQSYEVAGQDYLLAARPGGEGASLYTLSDSGTPRLVQTLQDTDSTDLHGITAMASTQIGGQTYVVAAAGRDNGISVLRHDSTTNRLEVAHDFGFDDKLPVTGPSALEIITVGGQQMVLMGAFDTGSLTVLSLGGGGQLGFVDQVNDTLETRFDGTAALATYSQGEVHLVAVGGNDGGLSLFQLLPGGRLVHRETLVDTLDTGLASVQQLEFVQTAGRVELVVLSARDTAITRFELDEDALGITATGTDGGARSDVLSASDAGGVLRGNAGDDVMIDGAGADQFYGGTGADIFIFNADEHRDIVFDFDPNTDKIDLSSYTDVSSIDDVQLRSLTGGVRLFIDDEELRLMSSDGSRLTEAQVKDAILFASDHVIIPEALAQTGSSENEVFASGLHADTIDGGRGYDTLSFEEAPGGATVDLSDNANNAGLAEGYVLSNIEGVMGSAFNDRLIGDDRNNTFTGLAGNDLLEGGAGDGWLTPGLGRDTVDGGDGADMVSFIDLTQGASINLVLGTATSGGAVDTLRNIENVTGTIYGDFIQGNDADNLIRGAGDYDWIIGSQGSDTIDGGNGRDMISYVYADAGVSLDLGAGRGLTGLAEGDTYISVERATGSIHPDLFIGSDGQDDFRGLGGYDWFVASTGGRDRYDGGTGLDTVSYVDATSGITASLQLGYGTRGDAVRDLYTDIERLSGSSFDDILFGDGGRNVLRGMWGEDALYGGGGVDWLYGGGSDDFLDGGAGWDLAMFDGEMEEYTITTVGRITYVDRIASGGEGTDTLVNVEALQFSDTTVYL